MAEQEFATLRVSRPQPETVVVELNRPPRLNALDERMFVELEALQRHLESTESDRVVVLTGAGRAFCSGLDLDVAARLPELSASEMISAQERWAATIARLTRLPQIVVAAVNGAAAGAGFGLALAADIRIASTTARFNAAFVRIGLSGGDVGTSWSLPRIVGLGRATEILLTGRFVDAAEALATGLVTQVTEPEDLLAESLALASRICGHSPLGMRLTKQVLRANVDAPSLDAAIALENRNQVLATRSPDMPEALAAFRDGGFRSSPEEAPDERIGL